MTYSSDRGKGGKDAKENEEKDGKARRSKGDLMPITRTQLTEKLDKQIDKNKRRRKIEMQKLVVEDGSQKGDEMTLNRQPIETR